jgi:PAS domain S-box-containing protein
MDLLRILVVDDHESVRRGLRSLLSSRTDWVICGEAKDGLDAVEMAKSLRPDIVLMDISMPRMDGVDAARIIQRELPQSKVIIISQGDPTVVSKQTAEIDARGYIAKADLGFSLLSTIDKVAGHRAPESLKNSNATVSASLSQTEVSLLGREADFRDFAETATIALHWLGPDGTLLWANQAELDMLGYTREEYFGHHVAEFHVNEAVIADIIARLSRGETLREQKAGLRCKDGSIRRVIIDSSVLFEQGRFVHTRCITRDLNDRRQAEARFGENERRFREMIDALPAAVYTIDAEGRLTHFNPAAAEFAGRVPQLGRDRWCVSWKLFRPDGTFWPHDECPMAVAVKEGRIMDGVEVIAERPNGERVWFTSYPRPLRDADGTIIGGINMLIDITERKKAERAASLLAGIVDSSDDAIVSKNLDGVITSWNNGAERLFGYTAEEACGQYITFIVPPDRRHEEAMILERLKRGERVEHFETVRVRKDGTTLDVSLAIAPVKDAAGRVIGASKVARDISERKQVELALRQSEERLRMMADGLETQVRDRTQELEQRNAEVSQQSKQLRELSNRLLQTQDNERRQIARELHDSAGQIVTALGLNLASIIPRIRQDPNLGKIVQDSQELVEQLSKEIRTMSYLLHPPLLDENGVSDAIRWYMQGLTERSGLRIELNIPESFGRLPREMELAVFRIVQECLTNIHRHSGSKTATIRLSRDAKSVSLEIQDDGKGIPAEKLARIQAQRSGVGITGIRERVRHFGGVLDIQSDGKGTKISITLPVPMTATAEPGSVLQQTRAAG